MLGIFWSMLAPLFSLLVMNFIFSSFFGRTGEHYIIYLFSGIVVMTYFSQSTNTGMGALVGNASIFSKVNVPKYLFVFSSVASASINFSLTLILFFVFVFLDGLSFHFKFFFLIFPIISLLLLSLGVAMILSAMNVFFKDIVYLYGVFMTALTYATPIFYPTSILGDRQYLFMFNPLFWSLTTFGKSLFITVFPILPIMRLLCHTAWSFCWWVLPFIKNIIIVSCITHD